MYICIDCTSHERRGLKREPLISTTMAAMYRGTSLIRDSAPLAP